MTVYKFLARYYGIEINYNMKYSHKDLKKLFCFLIPCNKNSIPINKEIIYVTDSYGKCVPYAVPFVPIEGYDIKKTNVKLEQDKKKVDESVDESNILSGLSKLSMYELGKLLSRYKNKPSFYKVIRKELEKRGRYTSKIHKLEVRNERLKESGINDKYQRRQRVKCKKS